MKHILSHLFIGLLLLSTVRLQAQVLSVVSGTDFNVVAGTVIGADSLDITPTANFTLNGTSLTHNTSASNSTSFPYIGSVYQFSNTTNPFSGSLQFVYNNATLNSIPTSYLSQHIQDGSNWNIEPVSSLNTSSNYLQTTGLSGVALNELTLATPPTWTGASTSGWTTPSNWIGNYVPISTSNAVIPTGVPNNPIVSNKITFNGLTINSGGNLTVSDTLSLAGNIANNGNLSGNNGTIILNGTNSQTINQGSGASDSIQNLIINNSNGVGISGAPIYLTGTLTPTSGTLNSNGFLTLVSSSTGTARIAQGTGNYISGNVAVERFITSKTARKYSFIGSPVSQLISNGWQKQIYITGSGTGGTTCGTTNGNGGNTDKFNSNGFDVTPTNAASIFTYHATPVNGSRWLTIPNTNATSLTPGVGYRVNIRGDRNSVNTNCANQLNNRTPDAPEAVTLSATGTVNTGDVTVTLNDTAGQIYTLVANPYPSQISYSAFQADNSGINNKMWTYSPFGNGNYTTMLSGIIVNAASGYDNTIGDYIASGQAFFVEANKNGSIVFHENHKINSTIPNTKYFGTDINKVVRIGLKSAKELLLDEVVVRLNNNGTKAYNPTVDAVSFNSGAQVLVVVKGTNKLAIATLPDANAYDTAQLGVSSTVAGTYHLSLNDFQGVDSAIAITLNDKFLGTSQDIRTNPVYPFNVTADTGSQGVNRFQLLFANKTTTLPVNFANVTVTAKDKDAVIEWKVANEQNIDSYQVERSTDAKAFVSIATVKATNSNSYQSEDNQLPENETTLYYRIKAIEKDGNTIYSNTSKLTTNNLPLTTMNVFPNPVQDKLNITLTNSNSNAYKLRVLTIAGIEVVNKGEVLVNNSTITIPASKLAAGVYLIELTDAQGNKQLKQFVKE